LGTLAGDAAITAGDGGAMAMYLTSKAICMIMLRNYRMDLLDLEGSVPIKSRLRVIW
jgi:hypothetical protein